MSEKSPKTPQDEGLGRATGEQKKRDELVNLFSRQIAESFSDISNQAQNILFYEMMGFLDGALEEFDTRVAEGHYDYLFDDEVGA